MVLAQLNIAKLLYPIDSPQLSEFVANLDRINALADRSPGFIWRFPGDDELESHMFDDKTIVNMSTWSDTKSLHKFVFRSDHTDIMRQRESWFSPQDIYSVLWWHDSAQPPSLEQAKQKLEHLRNHGPCEDAFTFRHQWPNPDLAE